MAGFQMSSLNRDALRDNRVFIVENLELDTIKDYMKQEKILSKDHFQRIEKRGETDIGINGEFLDCLQKRGPNAFKVFIYALMQSGQEHIAYRLNSELAEQWQAEQGEVQARGQGKPHVQVSEPSGQRMQVHVHEMACIDTSKQDIKGLLRQQGGNLYDLGVKARGTENVIRGRAIVINNQYFLDNKLKERDGASADTRLLTELFEELGFDTDVESNYTSNQIKYLAKKESSDVARHNYNCFLFFILSHGVQGYVYGTDCQRVSIQEDIIAPFSEERCPALKNKPKIFFIQACQGEKEHNILQKSPSVTSTCSSQSDSVDAQDYDDTIDLQAVKTMMKELTIQDDAIPDNARPDAHSGADVLVAYSTVPGYRSWRDPTAGSWFVTAIINVFRQYASKEHLQDLLTKVCDAVSNQDQGQYFNDPKYKQLTKKEDTFRKKLYFFPEKH